MRIVCFSAASVALCAAFVPRAIPFISLRTISAGRQREQTLQVRQNQTQSDAIRASGATSVDGATQGAGAGTGKSMATVGVIVCDHGSRRENANEMLFEVAERYRSFAGIDIVEAAHMELAEPSIEQAFDRCVAAGAQKVVLHPFFLSPGRHVTSDLPALMNAAAKRHPDIAWLVSEPLGLQELMPRVMHAAISESVSEGAWRYSNGGEDSAGEV